MLLEPYVFFNGRCEEALAFYGEVMGAEVTALMRYRDSPDPKAIPPGAEDLVMHANLRIGRTTVMASDGQGSGTPTFEGFALSLALEDLAEAKRLFKRLSDGGSVQMPLDKTFWSEGFGMLRDRFGVPWMVSVWTPEQG